MLLGPLSGVPVAALRPVRAIFLCQKKKWGSSTQTDKRGNLFVVKSMLSSVEVQIQPD